MTKQTTNCNLYSFLLGKRNQLRKKFRCIYFQNIWKISSGAFFFLSNDIRVTYSCYILHQWERKWFRKEIKYDVQIRVLTLYWKLFSCWLFCKLISLNDIYWGLLCALIDFLLWEELIFPNSFWNKTEMKSEKERNRSEEKNGGTDSQKASTLIPRTPWTYLLQGLMPFKRNRYFRLVDLTCRALVPTFYAAASWTTRNWHKVYLWNSATHFKNK